MKINQYRIDVYAGKNGPKHMEVTRKRHPSRRDKLMKVLHGPVKSYEFRGTRKQARAEARKLTNLKGKRIAHVNFVRPVSAEEIAMETY